MAPANVSDCVVSIIGGFTSGLDVFRRFRELRDIGTTKSSRRLKKTKDAAQAKTGEQEALLARSLRQGPEDIGREYQMCHQSLGDQYAIGDAIAHISLADIQLRLNTGLVRIIHKFLSRNKKSDNQDPLDYDSLLALSEVARLDTCRTLRDLYRRIKHINMFAAVRPAEPVQRSKQVGASPEPTKKVRNKNSPREPKVRKPTIARVFIKDSSRPSQIAIVKPGVRKKTHVTPASSAVNSAKKKASPQSSTLTTATPPPVYESLGDRQAGRHDKVAVEEAASKPTAKASQHPTYSPPPQYHAPQAIADAERYGSTTRLPESKVPPHLFAWLESTPEFEILKQPEYPAVPIASRPMQSARNTQPRPSTKPAVLPRRNIPTYHSAQTASTRLGEIPLHRWAEAWDFEAAEAGNRLAMQQGWPVTGELAVPKQLPEASGGRKGFWAGWRKGR